MCHRPLGIGFELIAILAQCWHLHHLPQDIVNYSDEPHFGSRDIIFNLLTITKFKYLSNAIIVTIPTKDHSIILMLIVLVDQMLDNQKTAEKFRLL